MTRLLSKTKQINCKVIFLSMVLIFVLGLKVHGQKTKEKLPLSEVLTQLENQFKIRFNYQTAIVQEVFLLPFTNQNSLDEKLEFINEQTGLTFSKINNRIYGIFQTKLVCGFLRDQQSSLALEGATITGGKNYTTTNEQGYFSINLSTHIKLLEIRFLGYETLTLNLELFSNNECQNIEIRENSQMINPIVLKGYLIRGIDKNSLGNIDINFSEFSLLPGLIEADVLQTLQSLPSVHSIDETISNLSIRGGSHDQNLILWDGIKMYQSGHFFGLISSFNPNITEKATLIQNGTDAYLTDGVSGTIDLQTQNNITKEFEGSFALNFLSADAFADIPISRNSSVQLAARKSINEFIKTPTYESYFDRVTQESELLNTSGNNQISNQDFQFYDTSLRWLHQFSENDKLRLNFIYANNQLSFEETNVFNQAQLSKTSSLSQSNLGLGLQYQRVWNSRISTEFQIYETDYDLRGINANVELDQLFLQENKVSETGTKLNLSWHHKPRLNSGLGYQFIETEITNLNDVDNPRFRILKSEVLRVHSLHYQTNYSSVKKKLQLNVGGRLNYLESFGEFILEPRIYLSKKIGPRLALEVAGEMKHQNSSQIVNFQNDFLGIEKRRWQLTDNDSIPIIRSKQASIGLMYSKSGTLLDLKGYLKQVDGITTQSQGFTTKYEFVREKGSYHVYGFELLFRKKIDRLNTWLSYSYMRNTYEFDNLNDSPFPSNFDIRHSLNVGITYTQDHLLFSSGFIYRSGNPTSSVSEINTINNEIVFNSANESRLDDYLRWDASLVYKFELDTKISSEIGASVWNILNKKNIINTFFRADGNAGFNEFSRFSLGTTANFVARILF